METENRDLLLEIRGAISQDELARRAGISRVTLARWETDVIAPRLNDVRRLAAVVGKTLEVRVAPAVHEQLIELVGAQLQLGPTARMRRMASSKWASLRAALQVAARTVDEGVVIGPAAAVLRGVPRPIGEQVDVLVRPSDAARVLRVLEEFGGAAVAGVETAPASDVQRYVLHTDVGGVVTIAESVPGVEDLGALIDRSHIAHLNADGIGNVRFGLVEDLIDLAARSQWPLDREYIPGLSAVLASGLYSSRDNRLGDAA